MLEVKNKRVPLRLESLKEDNIFFEMKRRSSYNKLVFRVASFWIEAVNDSSKDYDYVYKEDLEYPNEPPPYPPEHGGTWFKTEHGWSNRPQVAIDSDAIGDEILNRVIDNVDEDEVTYDMYDESVEKIDEVLMEFLDNPDQEEQKWKVLPAKRVNKIWNDYIRMGFVRDEKTIDKFADLVYDNILKLNANTVLSGHTPYDPDEYFDQNNFTEDQKERFYDDFIGDRFSDYALQPLLNDALELKKATTAEEKLQIMDRVFSRIHQRFELSELFIEGGDFSLDNLFSVQRMASVIIAYEDDPLYKKWEQSLKRLISEHNNVNNLSEAIDKYIEIHDITDETRVELGRLKSLLSKFKKPYENISKEISEKIDWENISSVELRKKQIYSKEFKDWFGDWENDPENASKVLYHNGEPKEVYHGTTFEFDTFDLEKASLEGHYGRCYYFTDDNSDADKNYAGIGPDMQNKIDLYTDKLIQLDIIDLMEQYNFNEEEAKEIEEDSDAGHEIARDKAMNELMGEKEDGLVLPLYLNVKNPVYVNGKGYDQTRIHGDETQFYYEPDIDDLKDRYDEEDIRENFGLDEDDEVEDSMYIETAENYDGILEDSGNFNKFIEAFKDSYDILSDYTYEEVESEILPQIEEKRYDGMSAGEFEDIVRGSMIQWMNESEEDISSGEFIKEVYKTMGYDGIILKQADKQFSMDMIGDTTHYHVFEKNQMKSSDRNSGRFDNDNDNIYAEPE